MTISIERVKWQQHEAELRSIRQQVFINEQHVPESMEWEVEDETAYHWLVYHLGEVIGCGRLLPRGKIGRMAIAQNYRNRGYGSQLLMAIIELARTLPIFELTLNAQVRAQSLYEKAGFIAYGQTFMEAGIPHIAMRLQLADTPTLGLHGGQYKAENFSTALLAMATQANRYLGFCFNDINQPVLAQPEMLECLSRLARQHPQSQIRFLGNGFDQLVKSEHPIAYLCRRLSSKIQCREYDFQGKLKENYMLADNSGIVTQLLQEPSNVQANYYQRNLVNNYWENFNRYWSFAKDPVGLKPLTL